MAGPRSTAVSAPPCRRCGHARSAHECYVPGGDQPGYCPDCFCWQYKPLHLPQRPWTRLLAWFRKRPEPVRADVIHPRPVLLPIRDSTPAEYDGRTLLDIPVHPVARPYATRTSRPPWETR